MNVIWPGPPFFMYRLKKKSHIEHFGIDYDPVEMDESLIRGVVP